MDFTEGQRKLLAYWGEIRSGVSQRVSTAELWEIVRNAATREGVTLQGVGILDMSRMRSIAAGQRTALENLAQARPDQVITGAMIARDLSARDERLQSLAPSWLVRFEHDVIVNGELQTVWRTSTFDNSLPLTIADLRAAVENDAEAMADDYDVSHAGIGQLEISAV
jgi:hypothetical protein